MTLPITFSAPGTAYEPSVEDCLRDGIYLMLRADDVNRKAYSYDDDNPAAGVRISSEIEQTDSDGRLDLPQQIVSVAFGSVQFQTEVSVGGTKQIGINIYFAERNDSARLEVDPATPPVTVLAKMARVSEILMKGTLYEEGQADNGGGVVDPYYSGLNEDGTYNQAELVTLNRILPKIVLVSPRAVPRKKPRTAEELLSVDLVRDIAVLYALSATYIIDMQDRKNMRRGGFNG